MIDFVFAMAHRGGHISLLSEFFHDFFHKILGFEIASRIGIRTLPERITLIFLFEPDLESAP